jgi:hypothetical protein
MKIIFLFLSICCLSVLKSNCQTDVTEEELNFQDIFLFKSAQTQKMLEVEDGLINHGTRVQQYFPYSRNGLADGHGQQWMIIPAGKRGKQSVYYIINYGFLKYLDAMVPLIVNEGNDGDNQLWILQRMGSNYMIKSYLANQYIEIPAGSNNDGDRFAIANFTGSLNQQFIMIRYAGQTGPPSSQVNQFVNITPAFNDNKALDASGTFDRNGAQLTIRDRVNGDTKEQWQIQFNSNLYQVKPRLALNKCMEDLSFATADGAGIGVWDCVSNQPALNQKWIIMPVIRQSGKFIFFNRGSGKCLTVSGGTAGTNGTPVVQFTYADRENSRWRINAPR